MSRNNLFLLSVVLSIALVGVAGIWSMRRHLSQLNVKTPEGLGADAVRRNINELREETASAFQAFSQAAKTFEQPSAEPEVPSETATSQNL